MLHGHKNIKLSVVILHFRKHPSWLNLLLLFIAL